MTVATARFDFARVSCYCRAVTLGGASAFLLSLFWFASRYPQLLGKAKHIGQMLPSMAYSRVTIAAASDASVWMRILDVATNWLDGMKIGMTFGVLFGALLHTVLRYYPLKIGNNLYLNSLKGALVGVPMGLCVNCAVPTACGVTRGHGRVETALGFLFSSPNFNPVVIFMTFTALPLAMSLTKYAILLFVILLLVPTSIRWLERDEPLQALTVGSDGASCVLPDERRDDCQERFVPVFTELTIEYGRNLWMLLKPTLTIILLASVLAATALTLVPWQTLLAQRTPLKLAFVSLISVLMPVPIALDVMFAAQLQGQGVSSGYVMLFAMTLGTFSIIPGIYLWRDVSKRLSVLLFVFFVLIGGVVGLVF